MQPAVNVASKSQLAKLLATENITVQHSAGAETASFDVKNRVLTLPVWKEMSNDLYDMLVIHEVGHALDTPADGWINTIKDICKRLNGSELRGVKNVKDFLNVVEDARIDKRQKRRFPGSKRNYVIAYKDLFERDFFGLKGREVNSLNFIDRMNVYFKGGFAMGIKFNAEERAFIKRAENAETWAEVVQLTEDIYAYAKAKQEADAETIKIAAQVRDEGDDDEDENESYSEADIDFDDDEDEQDGSGSSASKDAAKDDADGEDEADGKQSGAAEQKDDDASGNSLGNEAGGYDDELPKSETAEAFEQKKQELIEGNANHYLYVEVPEPNIQNILDDYKVVLEQWKKHVSQMGPRAMSVMMEEFNKWKAAENASISFMVKEFEMKKAADIYSRISIAKTGVINTNKLHSYKYNEDIFRRLAVVPQGKNHGFVMFLDWSGSMDHFLQSTMKQLYSMVLFCKRAQIPFEVYSFRSLLSSDTIRPCFDTQRANVMQLQNFKLRNILSSRMNGADLNFAMAYLLNTRGRSPNDYLQSTPLNQAIVAAEKVIEMFRAKSKAQIINTVFLTDGDSDPVSGFNQYSLSGLNSEERAARRKSKIILQDKKLKREYDLGTNALYNGKTITNALLRRLQDRTGVNLIGFFLTSGSFSRIAAQMDIPYSNLEYRAELEKFYKDNHFFPVTSAGYEKYFVINANKMRISQNDLVVTDDMSKSKIATAFRKFSQGKSVNRVLLRQFIELVAE